MRCQRRERESNPQDESPRRHRLAIGHPRQWDSPSNDDAATRFYLHRETREGRIILCLEEESNLRPSCYQHDALTTELPRRDTVARSPGRCRPVNESHESSASSCRCAGFEPETSEACAPLRRSSRLSYSGDRETPARITGTVCHAAPSTSDLDDVVSPRMTRRGRERVG